MAEYIEKSIAIAIVSDSADMYPFEKNESIRRIEDSTPAEVAPVVHGRWETNADPGEEIKDFHCSVCDYLLCDIDTACMIPGQNDFYFCPSCGAKMDLEE